MKAIIILGDQSRHEVEIDSELLARGRLEVAMNDSAAARVLRTTPKTDVVSTVRHCYRAGSDDGVPVFKER
ncbi:MAG TPA: hypothetical protein VH062_02330 [Polyangiaceae bacterium]|nr:hypothetical protein [Polyangiaceae bacterium]